MDFVERLIKLRKKAGLSQEDLADQLVISRQAVSKWERGESNPDIDNLTQLGSIYGVSMDYLLLGKMSDSNQSKDTAIKAQNKKNKFKGYSYFALVIFCVIILYILINVWR